MQWGKRLGLGLFFLLLIVWSTVQAETPAATLERGDYAAAIDYWSSELRQADPAGPPARRHELLMRRGEAYRTLGHYRDAVSDFSALYQEAGNSGDQVWQALAAGALGNAYAQIGQLEPAHSLLHEALSLARRLDLPLLGAATSNHLGNLLARSNQPEPARAGYLDALEWARNNGDQALVLRVRINLARLELADRPAQALAILADVHEKAGQLAPGQERVLLLLAVGRLAQRMEGLEGEAAKSRIALSHAALQEAAMAATALGDRRLISLAQGTLASLYESAGQTEQAVGLTEQAIINAQTVSAHDLMLEWEWRLGRLLRGANDRTGAVSAFRRAVYHVQAIRADIPIEYTDGRSSFRETLEPLYLGLTDLLLQWAGEEPDPDREQTLLTEARDTIELLKSSELQDYFKDSCVVNRSPAQSVDVIAPRTAILYPIILPDRLELLVSVGQRKYRRSVAVSAREINRSARRLARNLRGKADAPLLRFATAEAKKLHRWLIEPLAPLLESNGIDTLVYVPDGSLRLLPLTALFDGKRFLVERFAIVTVPGMSLLDPQPIPRQAMNSLLVGVSEPVQGFGALPGVVDELNTLSGLLPARVMLDQAFVSKRFEARMLESPYRIVHIASHGVFSGSPEDSFVLTYDARLDMNDLERLLSSGRFVDKPVELLTLSACQTAAGDDRAPLGLSGIALKSGVRSALGSLWSVADEAARALVAEFYTQLRHSGVSKAAALRRAQLKLLQTQRFRHPFFWSPFILVGNWL